MIKDKLIIMVHQSFRKRMPNKRLFHKVKMKKKVYTNYIMIVNRINKNKYIKISIISHWLRHRIKLDLKFKINFFHCKIKKLIREEYYLKYNKLARLLDLYMI